MADIAMIGDRDSVLLAKAAGLDAYGADLQDAGKIIHRLAKNGVKVIFITEELYMACSGMIEKYKTATFPAIIPIPDSHGSKGIGMEGISRNVEKAIGMDIFFSEDNK